MGYLIYQIVSENAELLNIEKIRNYGLSLFFFSNVIASILAEDRFGINVLQNPRVYVTTEKEILVGTIKTLWSLITPDINFDIEEYTAENDNFFDYKNVFKNSEFTRTMTARIKNDYVRLTRRNANDSFENIYNRVKSIEI